LAQKHTIRPFSTPYFRSFAQMPYVHLCFEDQVDASMRATATRIAERSLFEPSPLFHVPVLGSLHRYDAKHIESTCAHAVVDHAPPSFQFVQWELAGQTLRCRIASSDLSALASRLHHELPLGRPWASFYMTLGSVAGIEASVRADFLAAVSTAFPIDELANFTLKMAIEYSCQPPPKPRHEPRAHSSAPSSRELASMRIQSSGQTKKPRHHHPQQRSQHNKWKRSSQNTLNHPCMMDTATAGGISKPTSNAAARRGGRRGGRGGRW